VNLGVVFEGEMSFRLQTDMTVNCAVELRLLISRRETRQRPRGCLYARAPEGEAAHVVVVVTTLGIG
jgi:hypothetical protein